MKKISIYLTSFVCLTIWVSGTAQSTISPNVIPASGGYMSGAGTEFSWTIGEPVQTTFSSAGNMVSQGFEQPELQINTGLVSGALCTGASVNVPYTAYGIMGNTNVFTAQLSNAAGSFASPVNIGSVTGNTSGVINAIIPPLTPTGSGYRIRVISSLPVFDGKNNGVDLVISNCGGNTWIGGTTVWTNPANWTQGVPTALSDATIPTTPAGGIYPVITVDVPINSLTVQQGATVTVSATGALTVNGTLSNAGAVTIQQGGNFLQGNSSSYTGAGTFKVEKQITNNANGYRDISSPVITTVADLADDFSVSGQDGVQCWYAYSPYPNVQIYDEALSITSGSYFEGWLSRTGAGNVLNPMQGFAIRTYQNGAYALDFTGTPHNGAQSIAITKTISGTPSQDGWNFVGNPYPSSIDWTAVAALNPAITGSYYVFNTTNEYTGNWGTCNAAGVCTGLSGLSSNICSGQGFFVKANSSAAFVMNNSVRNATAANFYKTGEQTNEIRLSITDGTNSDEVVTYTDINATIGNDQNLDAEKIAAGSTVYLSFAMPGVEYAINVLQEITAGTELPLNVWVTTDGSYTINASALNISGSLTAYLKDSETNTLYNLATSSPSFALVGAQNYAGRFSIVFQQAVVSGIADNTAEAIKIYSYGKTVCIERAIAERATITITNVLGQQIAEVVSHDTKTTLVVQGADLHYVFVKVNSGNKISVAKVLISNR